MGIFLGPVIRRDKKSKYTKTAYKMLQTLLPSGQLTLIPDTTVGLESDILGKRGWLEKPLSLHIQASNLICCNGVIEFKNNLKVVSRLLQSCIIITCATPFFPIHRHLVDDSLPFAVVSAMMPLDFLTSHA